jgi:enediyne polyketide synthase
VAARTDAAWHDLLGTQGYALAQVIARESASDSNAAATRVWTAVECLKKAGAPPLGPLVLESLAEDHWVLFRSGADMIATWVAPIQGCTSPMALGILTRDGTIGG